MTTNQVPIRTTVSGQSNTVPSIVLDLWGQTWSAEIQGNASLEWTGGGGLAVGIDGKTLGLNVSDGPLSFSDPLLLSSGLAAAHAHPGVTGSLDAKGYDTSVAFGHNPSVRHYTKPSANLTWTVEDGVPTLVLTTSVADTIKEPHTSGSLSLRYGIDVKLQPVDYGQPREWVKRMVELGVKSTVFYQLLKHVNSKWFDGIAEGLGESAAFLDALLESLGI